jgi:hypothetical protein
VWGQPLPFIQLKVEPHPRNGFHAGLFAHDMKVKEKLLASKKNFARQHADAKGEKISTGEECSLNLD